MEAVRLKKKAQYIWDIRKEQSEETGLNAQIWEDEDMVEYFSYGKIALTTKNKLLWFSSQL